MKENNKLGIKNFGVNTWDLKKANIAVELHLGKLVNRVEKLCKTTQNTAEV